MKRGIIAVFMFFVFIMSACSNRDSHNEEVPEAPLIEEPVGADSDFTVENMEMEDVLYRREFYVFDGGYKVKSVVRAETSIFFHGAKGDEQILGIAQYTLGTDGEVSLGETRVVALPMPEADFEKMIYGICAGADSCFYVLTGELPPEYTLGGQYYTNPEYQGQFDIIKYSKTGEFLNEELVTLPTFSYIQGIFVDVAGRIILYGDNTVLCIEDGKAVNEASIGENSYIQSASLCGDTIVLQAYCDSASMVKNFSYDPAKGMIREFAIHNKDHTPYTAGIDSASICQGLDNEYIVCQDSRFYSCTLSDLVLEELFRWNYGVSYQQCPYVCRLADKSFICSVIGEEYLLATGLVQRPKMERSIVNVALYDMDESGIRNSLRLLNASQNRYEYIEKLYSENELARLLADISSGSSPDLLLFSKNVNTISNEFEDLYSYIDNDKELSRDSFLPNLLEGLTVDGELHELWIDTSINTIAARVSDVGTRAEMTVEDYEQIVAGSEKYVSVFQSYMSKENLLKWVSTVGISAFIDKENRTCDFDNPAFCQLLAWCSSMGNDIPEGSDYPSLDISEVLLSVETISTPERIKIIEDNFGEPYVFTGFPIGQGGGSFYVNGDYGSMAIPKTSNNKAGAWEFIRSQLIETAQMDIEYNLPVNIFALNRMAEKSLSESEKLSLINLLYNTKYTENYSDSTIRDIILECGRAYLAGDKTVEETALAIQSKVSIYLAEQYG